MNKELLVTTEYLIQKEQEWKEMAAEAEQIFCESVDGVEALVKFFYGKPVLALKVDFLARKVEGKREFEEFRNHLEKLEVIAFVYDKVERENRDFFKTN